MNIWILALFCTNISHFFLSHEWQKIFCIFFSLTGMTQNIFCIFPFPGHICLHRSRRHPTLRFTNQPQGWTWLWRHWWTPSECCFRFFCSVVIWNQVRFKSNLVCCHSQLNGGNHLQIRTSIPRSLRWDSPSSTYIHICFSISRAFNWKITCQELTRESFKIGESHPGCSLQEMRTMDVGVCICCNTENTSR